MARILIVEDEPLHRGYMKKAISGADREVIEAENESEAMELMQQMSFDVIVSDIRMDTEDGGMKVLKATMQFPSPPAVIMVTAYGDPSTGPSMMSAGAFDYIEKGMKWLHRLSQSVEEALLERPK